ncbi:MAG: ABC transporter ATP-binding protein [Gammaproteobacteria bacterium]|nr:ABC transporter ATP-binding protein [Gammaproteobacteria bacterium]
MMAETTARPVRAQGGEPVLQCRDLNVHFQTGEGRISAVNGVSFDLHRGQCLGIVGESGSGKSQTFLAILGLLASNGHATGSVVLNGEEILNTSRRKLNAIRGEKMAIVFQDSITGLTPHKRIGEQLCEVLTQHRGMSRSEARSRALEMLELVRIPEPARRFRMYPHEFSGGMRQRVMIAQALLCQPDVLIADEPTTALDVTVQAQILKLFKGLADHTDTALVMITHDLGVVAGLCDEVMVMYAGRAIEQASVDSLFYDPRHPYTRGLLACMPRADRDSESLTAIPGQPPDLSELPPGCAYAPRCPQAFDRCLTERPSLDLAVEGHLKACHLENAP